MFEFSKKDLADTHIYQIKNNFDDVPLCSRYLFIDGVKKIFIDKHRKYFSVYASPACHLEPLIKQSIFDVIYTNKDLSECIRVFNSIVHDIVTTKRYDTVNENCLV